MLYKITVGNNRNPAKEDAQFLGTLDLPNEEDDQLADDIKEAIQDINDCTFYFDEIEKDNNKIHESLLRVRAQCANQVEGVYHCVFCNCIANGEHKEDCPIGILISVLEK